jgi:hypothetical protein
MPNPTPLLQWRETVSIAFPKLSRPQATVLALWSYGMVLAKSCGLTTVSATLALQLGSSEGSLTQRLREWCYDAKDKKGAHRQAMDVTTCFAPLLAWVLSLWPADEWHVALAIDASTLSQRFTVLCVSVLYRGCAIPVAWKIVVADAKGSWQPHWKDLLTQVQAGVPASWTVIVLSDRGLYAPWLYTHSVSLGWHPFLRINQQGNFRPLSETRFRSLATAVPEVNGAWCGEVECFSEPKSRLRCTLLARWDDVNFDIPWEEFRAFRGRFGLFHGAIRARAGDPKGGTDLWNGSDQHTSAASRIAHAMRNFPSMKRANLHVEQVVQGIAVR